MQLVTKLGLSPTLIWLPSSVRADDAAQTAVVQDFDGWTVVISPGGTGFTAAADEAFGIRITPGPIHLETAVADLPPAPAEEKQLTDSGIVLTAAAESAEESAEPDLARVAEYSKIYNAIPFSRAEYDANPSYRHDATMELLFGKLRPTIVNRTTNMPAPVNSYPVGMPYGSPFYGVVPNPYFRFYNPYWRWYGFRNGYW